jgi:phage/plasmid-like protein (TIGR03299 family)
VTITADTRTDVNAAFAAERDVQREQVEAFNAEAAAYNATPVAERQAQADAAQLARFNERVAKGELIDLGNGRYQSTEGYDRGEIWTLRKSSTGDRQLLAMPEHGLDMDEITGKAKLYSAVPAWHGLGQVIPGGITSIDDVIRLGQLNVPAISIPVPDYTIPGLVDSDGRPRAFKAPGQFIVANGNTGEFWGTVGKVHKNIDVRVSFEFVEKLLGQLGITWESAGLMGGGRKVFLSCKVPAGVTIDAGGVSDHVELFIVIQDTRDGSGSYRVMITPWRPFCQNTNRFALRDALSVVSLRHTVGLPGQLEKARKVLGLTVEYAKTFEAEETALARTKTTTAEFEALMAELSALGKKDEDLSGRVFGARDRAEEGKRTELANNRAEDDLMERFAVESGRVGRTLYAAEQAYTGRLDWGMNRKGKTAADRWLGRVESNLDGTDDQAKTRAHSRLMQLVGGGTEKR